MRSILLVPLCFAILASGCASGREDRSGIVINRRTPDQFCNGTARSIAIDRFQMKQQGDSLAVALKADGNVPLINAITRSVYQSNARTDSQAADAGTKGCLAHFR